MTANQLRLKEYLDEKVAHYNNPTFIEDDPISIPHQFTKLQDIEIAGFWTAMLSWGQRKTIISKSNELMALMDHAPYQFITQHEESDRKKFSNFKHRTFQFDDTLYFLSFFQEFYKKHKSLEQAFMPDLLQSPSIEERLTYYHEQFFALPYALQRTRKHVSTPIRKSSCKRLNMFLRWMARDDDNGVDFGLWKEIDQASLMIPLDVHVFRIAHSLGLLKREKTDWLAVEELTAELRHFDPKDPVKYDYALFSIGVLEKDDILGL